MSGDGAVRIAGFIRSDGSAVRCRKRRGYALLTAVVAVNVLALMALMARSMWETEYKRDLEEELLFRARQYRNAIERYIQKNNNLFPTDFEKDLLEKKFIRKLYKDPMSEDGRWNFVIRSGDTGEKSALLIVPEEMLSQYISQGQIIGVASTSAEEGFRVYRGKKRYNEWAVYLGDKADKEMPELKFVDAEE